MRDDLVAQLGSRLRAEETGQWHSWSEGSEENSNKIEIGEEYMTRYAIDCLQIIDSVRSLRSSHDFLELSYERDIFQDFAGGQRRMFEFLGLPMVTVDWINSQKVSPAPRDFIANYDELTELVEETRKGGTSRSRKSPPP